MIRRFGIFMVMLSVGCSHQQSLEESALQQRLAARARVFSKVPYRIVFENALKLVRTDSFRVKASDKETGLILASYIPNEKDVTLLKSLGKGYTLAPGEVIDFVINLTRQTEQRTRVRLSVQRIQSFNLLGNHEGSEMMDDMAYHIFYDRLITALTARYPSMEVKISVDSYKKPAESNPAQPSS